MLSEIFAHDWDYLFTVAVIIRLQRIASRSFAFSALAVSSCYTSERETGVHVPRMPNLREPQQHYARQIGCEVGLAQGKLLLGLLLGYSSGYSLASPHAGCTNQ